MRVIRSLHSVRVRRPLCLAMGVFDGVHLGHQAIVSTAVNMAEKDGVAAAVLTFDPHPDDVLSPAGAPPLLTTTEEKLDLLRSLGVQVVIIVPFTRSFADTPAEEFIAEVLGKRLRACYAVVGESWRFGARGKGNLRLLQTMGARIGFQVCGVGRVKHAGQLVSSTRIRALLSRGHVSAANALLGRPYHIRGEVVAGAGRGQTLGFPTANLSTPPEKLLPADGVYACMAGVRKLLPAVASIGVRPTFERGGERRVEVHLLDPRRPPQLLGRRLHIQLIARLRGERRFSSAEALVRQMQADCQRARQTLAGKPLARRPPRTR